MSDGWILRGELGRRRDYWKDGRANHSLRAQHRRKSGSSSTTVTQTLCANLIGTPLALVSLAAIARTCQASMGHEGNGTTSWYNLDVQPSEAAVCIVGEIRIGVINVVAKHIRQTVVENNNADVGTQPANLGLDCENSPGLP